MDMNIQKYMAFIKTVETGSFTDAARQLSYSQSGISRMISDLENEWKVSLLERGKTGVRLTSDGYKLLPYAKGVCEEYEKLQMQIHELHGLKSGLIRIGTFSSVATHWLPKIIKEFQKDYPNIDYELLLGDYTEIEAWILEGRVDCGFLIQPISSAFESIPLGRDRLMAVLPLNHPYAGYHKVPLKELCKEPFMLLEKGSKSEITALLESNHLEPQIHFTTWDDYAIMSMVESGLGVSILPELILKRIPYKIAAIELDTEAYREISFVLKSQRTASLAVKKFIKYLEYRPDRTETKSFPIPKA